MVSELHSLRGQVLSSIAAHPANVTSWKYDSDDVLCPNRSTGDRAAFPD